MKPFPHPALRRLLLTCVWACLVAAPCFARQAPAAVLAPPAEAAKVSAAEAQSLLNRIKEVDSPTSRGFLYARVAAWLWRAAGDDAAVRQLAAEFAARGVSDIHAHEERIPRTPAAACYNDLLAIVRRHSAEEAERLERAYPLRSLLNPSREEKAAREVYAALKKLQNPETSAQALEQAVLIISSGEVQPSDLLGLLLRQSHINSPALPRLLWATLALEERRPGSVTLFGMIFLAPVFLGDNMPPQIARRFLEVVERATRLAPGDPRAAELGARSSALQVLQATLPAMQKLAPDIYPTAAARLAALAPNPHPHAAVFERIKNSADPLAETVSEAASTGDKELRRNLLSAAANRAKEQGKLRQAAELMAGMEPDGPDASALKEKRDEFLVEVAGEALKRKDSETAAYAASKVASPFHAAAALRSLAAYRLASQDAVSAVENLNEAAKLLERAPNGRERAIAYLRLAADFVELDAARAAQLSAEAVKAANSISMPSGADEGEFSWSLQPLADNATDAFRKLARRDRGGAVGLADAFHLKEVRVAATLGVYRSSEK
jgi:hypothetical protein